MKKVVWFIGTVAFFMNMAAFAANEVKIGFVDVQKVLTSSQAGQKTKKEIESLVSKKKEGLQKQEKTLQNMQAQFEKEQLTLSKSQKEQKQKDFQEKVREYQKAGSDLQKEVQKLEAEFTKKSLKIITEIVKDISDKDKYTAVFETAQSGMIYADDSIDLTGRVLKQFNIRFGS